MNKSITILLALWWSVQLGAAQEALPTIRILPEDIVQDSIQVLPFPTDKFAVRWTYTEAGARKMLAFWHAHAGHEATTKVGSFEVRGMIAKARPPGWTEEGWLKRRTDKFFGVSEDEAKKIVEGLGRK